VIAFIEDPDSYKIELIERNRLGDAPTNRKLERRQLSETSRARCDAYFGRRFAAISALAKSRACRR